MPVAEGPDYAELAWTGVETSFAPGISAQSKSHIAVTYLKDGVVSTLSDGVHIALAKAGAEGVTGAITATPLAMPAAPGTLRFQRTTPAVQPTDFANLAAYSPAVHTNLHDAAALRAQEQTGRLARLSDSIGEDVLDRFGAASTSAVTVGTGSKVFTIAADKVFRPGDVVMITSDSNPANFMTGPVTSYAGTTLAVNVSKAGGSGTHADWLIRIAGLPGADGPPGPPGPGSGDMLRANNLSDVLNAATAFNNIKQQATETSIGAAEIATQAEVAAGVDDARIVTPAKLAAHLPAYLADYLKPLSVIACTASGTNAITLTPNLSGFTAPAYTSLLLFSFLVPANITGNVTVAVQAQAAKKLYFPDGTTQVGSGDFQANNYLEIVYDANLDAGSGGWRIVNSRLSPTGVTAGAYNAANITVDKFGRITAASSSSTGVISPAVEFRTASATITIPANATKLKVTLVGGGGGAANSGAGGGGATCIKYLSGLTPGNTLALTIGAGGSAGAAGGATTLASGTQTITTLTAGGGAGGNGAGGGGGTATNGDLNISGGTGAITGDTNPVFFGGDSLWSPTNGGISGSGGLVYGGGARSSGAGAAGVAIFEWYA